MRKHPPITFSRLLIPLLILALASIGCGQLPGQLQDLVKGFSVSATPGEKPGFGTPAQSTQEKEDSGTKKPVPATATLVSPPKAASATKAPEISPTVKIEPSDTPSQPPLVLPTGNFVVSSYFSGSDASMSLDDAKALQGKIAKISADEISFDGKTCTSPSGSSTMVPASTYLGEFQLFLAPLGIVPDTVEKFVTSCADMPFHEVVKVSDSLLLLHWNGVLFLLNKQ